MIEQLFYYFVSLLGSLIPFTIKLYLVYFFSKRVIDYYRSKQ